MTKTRWLFVLGMGLLAVGGTLFFTAGDEGYLLLEDDVLAAQAHRALRQRVLDVDAEIAAAPADKVASLQALREALTLRVQRSRFADLSNEDLEHGLREAKKENFAPAPEARLARAIYGTDDRRDYYAVVEASTGRIPQHERAYLEKALEVSRGVGAWVRRTAVRKDGDGYRLDARTLQEVVRLCAGERFAEQPAAAVGTAFLVKEQIVVTADHVLRQVPITQLALVFDYQLQVQGEESIETVREVYYPQRVLRRGAGKNHDWAVVQLDRAVQDRPVLELARGTRGGALEREDDLYAWGHSSGTPKKMTLGTVRTNKGSKNFRVSLDAFGGDSGSPVLNRRHEVVGVLFGGHEDYAASPARGGCTEAAKVRRGAQGEYVTRVDLFRGVLPR